MKPIQISALLLAVACSTLWAQPQELTYNVVVKDRKGLPAKALTADQFEMTDGGNRVSPTVLFYDGAEVIENGQQKKSTRPAAFA